MIEDIVQKVAEKDKKVHIQASISLDEYLALKKHCIPLRLSMSGLLSRLIVSFIKGGCNEQEVNSH